VLGASNIEQEQQSTKKLLPTYHMILEPLLLVESQKPRHISLAPPGALHCLVICVLS